MPDKILGNIKEIISVEKLDDDKLQMINCQIALL